jgi:hypothetical protein
MYIYLIRSLGYAIGTYLLLFNSDMISPVCLAFCVNYVIQVAHSSCKPLR